MNGLWTVGIVLAWLAFLAGWWLGWQLLMQNGRMLLRLDQLEQRLNELQFGEGEEPAGLPAGSEAPAFELPDLAGKSKTLAEFRGQPLLLIFFNPACGFCRDLAPKLAALSHAEPLSPPMGEGGQGPGEGRPFVLIISTGNAEANRQLFGEYKLACPLLLQKETEVGAAYQAGGTPSGYLISPDGKIASELAMGAEALLALAAEKSETRNPKSEAEPGLSEVAIGNNGHERESRFGNHSVARSKIKRDGLKAGTPAPDFRLPRLDGCGDLGLAELRGRRVLLVFSSPTCGPCLTLAPELEKFHRDHPELEMVIISKGEPKENRAKVKQHGLTFPVVLQQQWEISRRYAMFATPIAYLIDEEGIIARDVAAGTDAILDLLSRAELVLEDA